jgi:hypothetical protein
VTDLRAIERRYRELAAVLRAPDRHVRFATTPAHDGSAHVELHDSAYWFVRSERGQEHERRRTTDEDELLYWLSADLIFDMALEWATAHRRHAEDFRRRLFARELELFGLLSPDWAARYRREIDAILARNPFTDGLEPRDALE